MGVDRETQRLVGRRITEFTRHDRPEHIFVTEMARIGEVALGLRAVGRTSPPERLHTAQRQPAVGIGDDGLPDVGGIGRQTKTVGDLGQSGFLCRTGCQPHCPQHQSQRTGSAHRRPQRCPLSSISNTGRLLPDRLQHPVIQPAGDRNLFHQIVIRTFHRQYLPEVLSAACGPGGAGFGPWRRECASVG